MRNFLDVEIKRVLTNSGLSTMHALYMYIHGVVSI